jgi:hypothetical protein
MIKRPASIETPLVERPWNRHRRSSVGIDSLLALVAFGTLGFLWAVLPNVNAPSETAERR